MSFFVAAKKDTKEVLEFGIRGIDLSNEQARSLFITALSTNYNLASNNLALYYEDENTANVKNIHAAAGAPCSWTPTWDGTTITGLDMSGETSKRIVKTTATKGEITADGTDSTVITIELWKADDSGIANTITADVKVPIKTPDGGITVYKVPLVNGVITKTFKTTKPGNWVIPAYPLRYANVRIDNQVTITSIANFSDL